MFTMGINFLFMIYVHNYTYFLQIVKQFKFCEKIINYYRAFLVALKVTEILIGDNKALLGRPCFQSYLALSVMIISEFFGNGKGMINFESFTCCIIKQQSPSKDNETTISPKTPLNI